MRHSLGRQAASAFVAADKGFGDTALGRLQREALICMQITCAKLAVHGTTEGCRSYASPLASADV